MTYRVIDTLPDCPDLLRLSSQYGRQIWAQSTLRKATRCTITCVELPAGTMAWRPLSNARNRMERISEEAMRYLVTEYQRGAPMPTPRVV